MASIFLTGIVGATPHKAGLFWSFQIRVDAPYRGEGSSDWFRCVIPEKQKSWYPNLDKLKKGTLVSVSGTPGFCHQSGSFQVRVVHIDLGRERAPKLDMGDTENGT